MPALTQVAADSTASASKEDAGSGITQCLVVWRSVNVKEALETDPEAYYTGDEMLQPLKLMYNSLHATDDDSIGNGRLLDVIRQVHFILPVSCTDACSGGRAPPPPPPPPSGLGWEAHMTHVLCMTRLMVSVVCMSKLQQSNLRFEVHITIQLRSIHLLPEGDWRLQMTGLERTSPQQASRPGMWPPSPFLLMPDAVASVTKHCHGDRQLASINRNNRTCCSHSLVSQTGKHRPC